MRTTVGRGLGRGWRGWRGWRANGKGIAEGSDIDRGERLLGCGLQCGGACDLSAPG